MVCLPFGIGLDLLGALQTQTFYGQRILFMREALLELCSSLDLCERQCKLLPVLQTEGLKGFREPRFGAVGDDVVSQGEFHLSWTVHPPGAELHVGTRSWKKPMALQPCPGCHTESVAISSGWVIIRNKDFFRPEEKAMKANC